jgi:hypothetical protein
MPTNAPEFSEILPKHQSISIDVSTSVSTRLTNLYLIAANGATVTFVAIVTNAYSPHQPHQEERKERILLLLSAHHLM